MNRYDELSRGLQNLQLVETLRKVAESNDVTAAKTPCRRVRPPVAATPARSWLASTARGQRGTALASPGCEGRRSRQARYAVHMPLIRALWPAVNWL
jgi:hypothetical protein